MNEFLLPIGLVANILMVLATWLLVVETRRMADVSRTPVVMVGFQPKFSNGGFFIEMYVHNTSQAAAYDVKTSIDLPITTLVERHHGQKFPLPFENISALPPGAKWCSLICETKDFCKSNITYKIKARWVDHPNGMPLHELAYDLPSSAFTGMFLGPGESNSR